MPKLSKSKRLPIIDKLIEVYYKNQFKGFSRIWKFLRFIGYDSHIVSSNKYGADFFLDPLDYIDSNVIKHGYYESEVLECILEFLDTDSVFWDIGANLGLHSITVKYLRPECQVVSIEPSPIMSSLILRNAQLNNIELSLINIALSDVSRLETLHLAYGNSGMTTIKPWEKATYANKITCWCETANNLARYELVPKPTVIKIDVEGSEIEVLRGASNILESDSLKAIIFESEINFLNEKNSSMYQLLNSYGFKFRRLTRKENTSHNLDNFVAFR